MAITYGSYHIDKRLLKEESLSALIYGSIKQLRNSYMLPKYLGVLYWSIIKFYGNTI